jgi:phosphoglycolate phosphatase
MPQESPKTILLDLDGTLTDPSLGISKCIIHALKEMNVPVPLHEQLDAWIGPPLLKSFGEYFESLGIDKDENEALRLYRERFSDKGLFENEVYKGIPAALSALQKAGLNMFLATAKPIVFARQIVDHFGLDQYLSQSYGAELDGTRSDKTDLINFIIECESLDPARCLMVGDREHDMIGARNNDVRAVGVSWGFGSNRELLEAGAEILLDVPHQLLDLI